MGSTYGKVIESDEGINMGDNDVKLLDTILGNAYIITLGLDVVTYPGSFDGSFDGYNDGKLEGLLIGDPLGYTDGKVLDSDKGIKL